MPGGGDEPVGIKLLSEGVTGGVSMGGRVTRYALTAMGRDGDEHQTETYLSWDAPHNGAWIPLILQQQQPVRLGGANGRDDGGLLGLTPGEVVFDKKFLGGLVGGATARFQPDHDTEQPVGGMHLGLTTRTSTTTAVAPFDGAPGGTLDSFGQIATALGIELEEFKRWSCFVPSGSAVALKFDPTTWPVELDKDRREVT